MSNISEEHKMSTKTYLTPQEQINVIYGLCRHLLAGGDYSALVQYSQYYGLSYLLDPTFDELKRRNYQPRRIVEFGAGLGWFGRGLGAKFGMLPTLLIDKRPWALVNLVADLETSKGREEILHKLEEGDLIVASDLVHCLDDPGEIMANFSAWPTAILEYCPVNVTFRESYSAQISRYGAWPIFSANVLEGIFSGRTAHTVHLDPYVLMLVDQATED